MAEPVPDICEKEKLSASSSLRRTALLTIAMASALVIMVLTAGTYAQAHEIKGNLVRVGCDYVIPADTTLQGNVIVFGGNIEIHGDLHGRAIAIGGTVRADGSVTGDITAIGGRAVLLRGATITGSVTAIGGGVERSENVALCGEVNSISLSQGLHVPQFRLVPFQPRSLPVYALYLLGLYISVLTVGYFFPEQASNADQALAAAPWRSLLVGIIVVLLILPVTVLMAISVVGLPLILLVWLGFLVAKLLGYVAVVRVSGRLLVERLGFKTCTAIHIALGVLALGFLRTVPYAGIIFGLLVFLTGLGAALISRLGMGGNWLPFQLKRRSQ